MTLINNPENYMREALIEATLCFALDEVPVGAIIVHENKIISRAHNLRESLFDPTAHAEILAIREAARVLDGWRLINCTLFVTLEPCAMCAGAIINSRIERVVFGAYDPKGGCCGSVYNLFEDNSFNHHPLLTGGICQDECSAILSKYFKTKR